MIPVSCLGETEKAADLSGLAVYVGGQICAQCHPREYQAWSDSHHDLAMQPATRETVLGDFDNHALTHHGVSSFFYRRNDSYMVRTEGPVGRLEDFQVKYSFGVEPLQQYLIEFPGGRLQALGLAWDTRPKAEGGQRWFHLYPDEKIAAGDELHWTQASQNWNSMCAECHSTHVEKQYDPANGTFSTTWSEIDVSCEACHGPGSAHVTWAERGPDWERLEVSKGLVVLLDERRAVHWSMNAETGNASRSRARSTEKEIEMCARCHARRSPLSSAYAHGEPFLDHYMPRLLDQGMYFADGQIHGEAYVYGSFLQSKMYRAGVTCSDCHEPHSLQLRARGNALCLRCHAAAKYDQAGHHFHKRDSKGASCVECHMPSRTYMVVDQRHDHSMRIPRPDLSSELGTPNACNGCHRNKSFDWAKKTVTDWYGRSPAGFQSFAQALHSARTQRPDAGAGLAASIRDSKTPAIARATALERMGPYLDRSTADVLTLGLTDKNPLVRAAAVRAMETAPTRLKARLAAPMLSDPVRAVRIEAARLLAAIPDSELTAHQRSMLAMGIQQYVEAQQAMAERPEAQTNLGDLYAARGAFDKAVSAYQTAIDLNPGYVPAYVNLADLFRARGQETRAEAVLRSAIEVTPGSAAAQHALGLSLVRQKRRKEAVEPLRLASTLDSDSVRYTYVYAVALNSIGSPEQAIQLLQDAHNKHPHDHHILRALAAFNRDLGNLAEARTYAEKLHAITR